MVKKGNGSPKRGPHKDRGDEGAKYGQPSGTNKPGPGLMEGGLAKTDRDPLKKVGRNDPCPCGSGKKYKKCCLLREHDPLFLESQAQRRLEAQRAQTSKKTLELYELIAQKDYSKALDAARSYSATLPHDDRAFDAMVTALLMMEEPQKAYDIALSRYTEAKREKDYFLRYGRHSWESQGSGFGYGYAPETWLEKVWVSKKAMEYKENYPKEPDPRILVLVNELMKAEDLSLYPQTGQEGFEARKQGLSPVVEELALVGSKALPYILPLSTRYGWSGLLVPGILGRWADDASIRALMDISMFHYPFLSESALRELESIGEGVVPHLKRAFEEDVEFDPLKTGLLSVAKEIGTERSMRWLVDMLQHPSPFIVNWTAGLLGKSGYAEALPALKEALGRVGDQPYLLWAIEELEPSRT